MSDPRPISLTQRLPANTDAPRAARILAAEVLAKLGAGLDRAEDLALIVSELVTNAVIHGPAGDVVLRVEAEDRTIRVEVSDSGTDVFEWRAEPRDGHWGLGLVSMFSERSGIIRSPSTRVWCELDLA